MDILEILGPIGSAYRPLERIVGSAMIPAFIKPGQEPLFPVLYENKKRRLELIPQDANGKPRFPQDHFAYGFTYGCFDPELDGSAMDCAKREFLEEAFNAPILELLRDTNRLRNELYAASGARRRTVRTPDEIKKDVLAARQELLGARQRAPKCLIDETELVPLLEELKAELADANVPSGIAMKDGGLSGITSRTLDAVRTDIIATEKELAEAKQRGKAVTDKNFLGDFLIKNDVMDGPDLYFSVFTMQLPMSVADMLHPGPEQNEVRLCTLAEIRNLIKEKKFFNNQARAWDDIFLKVVKFHDIVSSGEGN